MDAGFTLVYSFHNGGNNKSLEARRLRKLLATLLAVALKAEKEKLVWVLAPLVQEDGGPSPPQPTSP
ncbi:hypothetical protein CONLIGDRAFT_686818 [Coniochaeta ligniaria NRRL 30616]|uniref:Uncharacterized protein n=1 Tax=Coniochaeta ligniaria NRRL 30616 TaxID=1408157 RepID=A0A1J7J2J1_9PEZI|nr:hypothetical protein CONLIGDRAFT_686818 [Coniochaeta ligniaria NRRL 30616]